MALTMLYSSSATAQSLFSQRASASQAQSPSASTKGSLFSSNIGFPRSANATSAQGQGGSFIGRSNRGFVGAPASSPSSSPSGDLGDANRRSSNSRSAGNTDAQTETPFSAEQQRETGTRSRRTRIIPRHRIAFDFPAKQATAITDQLTMQLANLSERYPNFAHIKVLVESNGLVKLLGEVPTDSTRKLAAIIVGLEPGVRSVQNELKVAGDAN